MSNRISEDEFLTKGYEILDSEKELMIFVRYPYQAGSSAYILMDSKTIFSKFVKDCNTGDSVAIIHSFEKVKKGKVNDSFIQETILEIEKYDFKNWVLAWLVVDLQEIRKTHYYELDYIGDREELMEVLEELRGREVQIVKEPDGFGEELTTHIYKGGYPSGAY